MALQRSIYILEKEMLFLGIVPLHLLCKCEQYLFKFYALRCLKAFSLSLDAALCNIL